MFRLLAGQTNSSSTNLYPCSDIAKVSREIAVEMSKTRKTAEFAKNSDAVRYTKLGRKKTFLKCLCHLLGISVTKWFRRELVHAQSFTTFMTSIVLPLTSL